MHKNITSKKKRLNVQIPFELKDKLNWASAIEGKKMSVLVRESIRKNSATGGQVPPEVS